MQDYQEFLAGKMVKTLQAGFEVDPDSLPAVMHPLQRYGAAWALRQGRAAVFFGTGLGKGFPVKAPVLSPSGWREIGSLCVGDFVFGRDGISYPVTGFYPRGAQETYRISFSDGTSVVCDADHLWTVRSAHDKERGKDWKVLATKEIIASSIRYSGRGRTWEIPMCDPVRFPQKETLPLHPYLLGVLLGDGSMYKTPSIHGEDDWIIEKVSRILPEGVHLVALNNGSRCRQWSIAKQVKNCHVRNPVSAALEELDIYGKTGSEKFVPKDYLFSSVEQRIAILQGLMDTDGYCGDPTPEFSNCSRQLADAVVWLVESLGGTGHLSEKKEPSCWHKGEKSIGSPSWRVTMSLPEGINPFSLPRKANKYRPTSRGLSRRIDSIESVGPQETVCISVDSPDDLFLTEHCVVTHNTGLQLVFADRVAKHTGKPSLLLAPLAVAPQTVREGQMFGVDVNICRSQASVKPGVNITNYQKLLDKKGGGLSSSWKVEELGAVVCDESSILKSMDGKTKTVLCEAFARTPYRLCCTATPSPNDHMELGNHAEFLGIMSRDEMLSRYFCHDGGDTSKWRLKGHAQEEFWRWVCSWAICATMPSDLGFDDTGFVLPPLNIKDCVVDVDEVTGADDGWLFRGARLTATSLHKEMRNTVEDRAAKVAELVNGSQEAWIIWCNTNYEADALRKMILDAVEVRGNHSDEIKEERLSGFSQNKFRVLLTKASIAGWGLNYQNCHNVAVAGLSYSHEQFFQLVRRCWRFGQKKSVNVHVIYGSGEGGVLETIRRKEKDHEIMQDSMREATRAMMIEHVQAKGACQVVQQEAARSETGAWELRLGDCVEGVRSMEEGSIDYTIYSPPFSSLYVYSDALADMGNSVDDNEFFQHFGYLVPELLRVTKPGRLMSFHCMNLPLTKARDGVIGLRDFRGDLIKLCVQHGWVYHSEVCIWKDPVTAMQRTHAIGLLYKQLRKDSAMSRQGIADYLVTMRKPGENPSPVTKSNLYGQPNYMPVEVWQNYASPVWMDINPSETLQKEGREERDEKHVCPLQLQVIRRAIELWTNPGDLILDPFTGIASTGYEALLSGRRFIGTELKKSYWKQAKKNLEMAEKKLREKLLFPVEKVQRNGS